MEETNKKRSKQEEEEETEEIENPKTPPLPESETVPAISEPKSSNLTPDVSAQKPPAFKRKRVLTPMSAIKVPAPNQNSVSTSTSNTTSNILTPSLQSSPKTPTLPISSSSLSSSSSSSTTPPSTPGNDSNHLPITPVLNPSTTTSSHNNNNNNSITAITTLATAASNGSDVILVDKKAYDDLINSLTKDVLGLTKIVGDLKQRIDNQKKEHQQQIADLISQIEATRKSSAI